MRFVERYWWIIGLLALFVSLVPMTPGASFDGDWYIHLWFARYFSNYIGVHHSLPWVVNTTQAIGVPINLFYAYILNPLFGTLSIVLGPHWAARVIIIGVSYLEYFLVFKLVHEVSEDKILSLGIALLTIWAIYPYTVVFTEAAIPEFFATTLVVCAFSSWFLFLLRVFWIEKIKYILLCALCLAFSMGTHPITAFYSGIFFLLVFPISLLYLRASKANDFSRSLFAMIGLGCFTLLFLSPWLYSTVLFMNKINIAKDPGLIFYPQDADSWWTRFQIFPFDKRSLLRGQMVNTSYLDTQINMAFVFLNVGFAWATQIWKKKIFRNPLFILGLILFLLTSWMSLSPFPYRFLPRQFKITQFGWRLITYQNLSVLLVFLSFLFQKPSLLWDFKKAKPILLAGCLTLSFVGALERFTHTMGTRNPIPRIGYDARSEVNSTFVSMLPEFNYPSYLQENIPTLEGSRLTHVNFGVGLKEDFGEVLKMLVQISAPGWVITNVGAFEWNRFYVDGKQLEKSNIKKAGNFLAVKLDSGTQVLETSFEVPRVLRRLKAVSILSLFFVFISFCFVAFKCLRRANGRGSISISS